MGNNSSLRNTLDAIAREKDVDLDFVEAMQSVEFTCFLNNPELSYAQAVATGSKSYYALMQPVKEQYELWWNRINAPAFNPRFDKEVAALIYDLNAVDVAPRLDPKHYFTSSRDRVLRNRGIFGVATGSALTLLLLAGSYLVESSFGHISQTSHPFALPASLFLIGSTTVASLDLEAESMKTKLHALENACKQTDKYLRDAYQRLQPFSLGLEE